MSNQPPYPALCERLGLPPDIDHDPNWSAAPDFLEQIVGHALETRPATLLECSSGVTTVMLAACCAQLGHGHVYSLENGPEFAAATRAQLKRLGLAERATVIDAPLVPIPLAGQDFSWYSLDALTLADIDMLVIDGPPGFLQPCSRYPALPALHARLSPSCAVFLDDAGRPDEREIVARWLAEFPDLNHQYLETARGCSILRR